VSPKKVAPPNPAAPMWALPVVGSRRAASNWSRSSGVNGVPLWSISAPGARSAR
jgi:hypothetical protein